ncbi:MAG TPA: DUF998 domain-containing protein [Candidatus Saccharimonadales bacterium]|nr:DUF998 domain-containing protein [Candidatus Saccharimonadales bacterium]
MNRNVESFAKYAGLATVAVEWSALLIYYLQMPLYFGWKYPISFFATLPETRWAFSACYTLAAICFWIFTKHHLAKYFTVPLKIFAVSLTLFAATGLLPYNPDDTASVVAHVSVALSSGLLFLVGMFVLAKKSQDRQVQTVTYAAILLSFALTMLFLLSPKESHLIFAFEAGSWLMLQLWTIWISFYVHKKNTAR